jgi:hypothetical protein
LNDPLQPDVDSSRPTRSSPNYWKGAVGECGVGALTQVAYRERDAAGDLSDGDVRTWLADRSRTTRRSQARREHDLHALLSEQGRTTSFGSVSCQTFRLHDSFPLGGDVTSSRDRRAVPAARIEHHGRRR